MPRPTLLALFVPLLFACKPKAPEYEEICYPDMVLSEASVEFGDAAWGEPVTRTVVLSNQGCMPMGVGSIAISEEATAQFEVSWDAGAVTCPEGSDTGASATAKVDTGGTPGGDTGSGGGEDTGSGDVQAGALLVLDPGCEIPLKVNLTAGAVGDIWGALVVESIQADLPEDSEEDLPPYLRDPIHWKQLVYLHGESERTQGTIVVSPRSHDFGFVHPDAAEDEEPARIKIANVGDGDITLADAVLSGTCDAAYTISHTSFQPGDVLEGGESTLLEVSFTPTDTDPAYCQLEIASDDPANPTIDVTFTGNSGTDPENEPPTVFVRSPDNGYKYDAIRPLELELNVFDVNQPATSLTCKVKSAVLQLASIATCTPSEESGHVIVEIPADNFDAGVDTLLVTVTDGSGTSSYASVSVVVNTDYPEDDDDGDGFGALSEPADCDDADINTYPEAAEIYDGKDNDCDNIVDEDTEGADDDGDSFSEVSGDCNDHSNDVFPGGPERGDGMDNDCDGVVDEGTSLFDDDGDGFAEVNNDCDDSDDTVNPSAREVCDGVDNDCDGLRDSADGCIALDSDPVIVGKAIHTSASACLAGETVSMDVLVYDADGQTPTYQWTDDGQNTFDNPVAPSVRWTCPSEGIGDGGANKTIYVVVLDPDSHQDWAFEKIAVYPEDTDLYEPFRRLIVTEE